MVQKKSNSKQSESSNGKKNDNHQNAYFLSLELENVRCVGERQIIDFSDGNNNAKRWTIILGNNGTGKTTLLQSLIGMIPIPDHKEQNDSSTPNYTTSEFPYKWGFLRNNVKEARFLASFSTKLFQQNQNGSTILNFKFKVQSVGNIVAGEFGEFGDFPIHSFSSSFTSKKITMNCFAYGASRKTGGISLSDENDKSSYKTLFDEKALLINPEEWLLQADYTASKPSRIKKWAVMRRDKVIEVLKLILPDVIDIELGEFRGYSKKPRVEFKTPYGWVEAKDLSLGYRTSMAWIVDFASRMFDLYPESENPLAEPAVVLIDEIDLHLHPKWQRKLLDYLSNLFPNTQFIVTTHSPLIVQSAAARDANMVVCRREGDHVVIDQSVEAVKNWRADQILTSDLFGLETSRPKEIEKDLLERQAILSKAKLTKKDEKRLTELEEKIGSVPVMENPKYDEAMDIIFRAAEKLEKKNGSPK